MCSSLGAGPPATGPAVSGVLVGGAIVSLAFWFSVFSGGAELRPRLLEGIWVVGCQPFWAWGMAGEVVV